LGERGERYVSLSLMSFIHVALFRLLHYGPPEDVNEKVKLFIARCAADQVLSLRVREYEER
jgi:hypothetical protein